MRQFAYTMFIANNRAPLHLWQKENLVKYQKSQIVVKMIVRRCKRDERSSCRSSSHKENLTFFRKLLRFLLIIRLTFLIYRAKKNTHSVIPWPNLGIFFSAKTYWIGTHLCYPRILQPLLMYNKLKRKVKNSYFHMKCGLLGSILTLFEKECSWKVFVHREIHTRKDGMLSLDTILHYEIISKAKFHKLRILTRNCKNSSL